MSKHEIISITKPDDSQVSVIAGMFREMYREMQEKGLLLPLDEEGGEKWIRSIGKTLGRYSHLVAARNEEGITGFAHGALKFTPDYLGSQKVGVVTHIYILKKWRSSGIGMEMLKELEDWFHEQQVHSIELQVLAGNSAGIAFWEKTGYARELLQYRKIIR